MTITAYKYLRGGEEGLRRMMMREGVRQVMRSRQREERMMELLKVFKENFRGRIGGGEELRGKNEGDVKCCFCRGNVMMISRLCSQGKENPRKVLGP
jgi:hypothetical protein